MGTTTALRREIKHRFIPLVVQRGYSLDERDAPTFWLFRRQEGSTVRIFGIQWEKYGRPRFRFDFGTCPAEGLNFNGNHVDWNDMHPHWLPQVASLKPGRGSQSGLWFRQDCSLLARLLGAPALRPAAEVVDDLVAMFEEVEMYWASGVTGRHIHLWPR